MNTPFIDSSNNVKIIFPSIVDHPSGIYCLKDTAVDFWSSFKQFCKHPFISSLDFITSGLFWSIIFICVSSFINAMSMALTDVYYIKWLSSHPEIPKTYTLPDLGADYLPFIDSPYVPTYVMTGILSITFLRFLFTPYRFIVLRRFCFLQGIIFILRSFSVFSTFIPSPVPCNVDNQDSILIYAIKIFTGTRSCHDLMFCPHTSALFICAMIWYHYTEKAPIFNLDFCSKHSSSVNEFGYPLRLTFEKIFIIVVSAVSSLVFVMCRRHYSFDVYIAAVISIFIFKLYHHYILYIKVRHNWLNTFFGWFEEGAPDIPEPAKNEHQS
ncbi:hypothetical protein QTN25_005130 [Entamoeba marina]